MTWLSTKETAELLGYEESSIRKKAEKEGWKIRKIPGTGRGGVVMEILLESLPEEAQKTYYNETGIDFQLVDNNGYTSKKQKADADEKDLAVAEHAAFEKQMIKQGYKKGEIMAMFINEWDKKHPNCPVKYPQKLYRWRATKKEKGSNIDGRGGHNRGTTCIPKYYVDYFSDLYLRESRPSAKACEGYTRAEAERRGESNLLPKSSKPFRNLVKNISEPTRILKREGEKAFNDKCFPSAKRDYTSLSPNDIWVADHHKWDVFIRVPDNHGGWKKVRPWGSYWMDIRTRKMISWVIRTDSPNADIVLYGFSNGVKKYGIPKMVYMDNGKDYRVQDIFNGKDSKEDDTFNEKKAEAQTKAGNNIAAKLQIEVTYALPYHGQSKPIERAFETYEGQFGKFFKSYTGKDAKERPENLKDLDIEEYPTLEEFIVLHDQYCEVYNNLPHSGNGMDNKTPNQVYNQLPYTKRTASSDFLQQCLMRSNKHRKVGKNGITFNKCQYKSEELYPFYGKEVIIRYDPQDKDTIYVYDIEENYIAKVYKEKKTSYTGMSKQDYERLNHEKKQMTEYALNSYVSEHPIDAKESINNYLENMRNSIDLAGYEEPTVIEPVRNEKIEQNAVRASLSGMERNRADILKQDEARRKAQTDTFKKHSDVFNRRLLDREKETRKEFIG